MPSLKMDKNIKLLLKIIGICFIVEIILIILLIASLFSFNVYQCYNTGGRWIFDKASEEECMDLGVENCNSNYKCVLRSKSLADFGNPSCKPKSGCRCPESSKTWYSFRGCS